MSSLQSQHALLLTADRWCNVGVWHTHKAKKAKGLKLTEIRRVKGTLGVFSGSGSDGLHAGLFSMQGTSLPVGPSPLHLITPTHRDLQPSPRMSTSANHIKEINNCTNKREGAGGLEY